MNIILQPPACCACSFTIGGEMKARLLYSPYQDNQGGGEEHQADVITAEIAIICCICQHVLDKDVPEKL